MTLSDSRLLRSLRWCILFWCSFHKTFSPIRQTVFCSCLFRSFPVGGHRLPPSSIPQNNGPPLARLLDIPSLHRSRALFPKVPDVLLCVFRESDAVLYRHFSFPHWKHPDGLWNWPLPSPNNLVSANGSLKRA